MSHSIYPQAVFKVASGGGTNWDSTSTWVFTGVDDDTIPDINDSVILDNSYRSGSYTINIDSAGKSCGQLTIGYSGNTNTITLYITGGDDALTIGYSDGYDLIISDGGVVDNSSTASGANHRGIEFAADSCGWRMIGGGKYIHNQGGGSFPDAYSGNITDINFDSSSVFEVRDKTNWSSSSGGLRENYRTKYGSLVINIGTSLTLGSELTSGDTLMMSGDLTIKNGSTFRRNRSGSTYGTIYIGGNLIVEDNADFYGANSGNGGHIIIAGNATTSGTGTIAASNTSGSGTITVAGDFNAKYVAGTSSNDTLEFAGGTAASVFDPAGGSSFRNLIINNSNGVILGSDIELSSTLNLSDGNLTTSGTAVVIMDSSTSILGGSDSSFIKGPLTQIWGTNPENKIFPIGKDSYYRPIEINFISPSSPEIKAEMFDSDAGGDKGVLNGISNVRYFSASLLSGSAAVGGSVKITFGGDDGVTDHNTLVVAQSSSLSGTYKSLGQVSSDASSVTSGPTYNPADGDFLLLGTTGTDPLPVEMSTFSAESIVNKVLLRWRTKTEVNNYGFEIQRTTPLSSPYQGRDAEGRGGWRKIGFVKGFGSSNSSHEYNFKDEDLPSGKYLYRLKQIDNDGSYKYSDSVEVVVDRPSETRLYQNYPNPFNPSTKINYRLSTYGRASLKLFDILGNEVAVLFDDVKPPGEYSAEFNALRITDKTVLASGLYFYVLSAGGYRKAMKMILQK